MQIERRAVLGATLFATAALAEPTKAAPAARPVVAIVEIDMPWYAPAFLVRSKMRDTISVYESLPGLAFKYFSISDASRFGGIYLWRDAATAHAWYSPEWFADVQRKRGAPADVRFFDVKAVQQFAQVGRNDHSDAVATLLTGTDPGEARAADGLLRRYDLRAADGRTARLDLWSGRTAADRALSAVKPQATAIEWFAVPILLPSALLANREIESS